MTSAISASVADNELLLLALCPHKVFHPAEQESLVWLLRSNLQVEVLACCHNLREEDLDCMFYLLPESREEGFFDFFDFTTPVACID